MNNYIRFPAALTITIFLLPAFVQASGAFAPGARLQQSENYNLGKAIVTGQAANIQTCKSCHKKFSRSNLRQLNKTVSGLVVDCSAHTPCYNSMLNEKQMVALDAYFAKRYRLQ